MEIGKEILEFCDRNFKDSKRLNINHSLSSLEDYVYKNMSDERIKSKRNRVLRRVEEIKESYSNLADYNEFLFYLFSPKLRWKSAGFKNSNGDWINPIRGGFCLPSFYGVLTAENVPFWNKTSDYNKYSPRTEKELELLKKLKWFDSPSPLTESGELTPFFSCFEYESGKFPDKLIFFDSHITYSLPFSNYSNYFKAMMDSVSVEYWQFFYINPQEIIEKNINKSYFSIFLESNKIKDHSLIHFNPEIKADRLDIIHEYLERCVTTLPLIFPEMDFTYHKDYFEKFNALYLEARK